MGKNMQNIDEIHQSQKLSGSQTDSEKEKEMYYIKNLCTFTYKKCRKLLHDTNAYGKLNKLIQFLISNPLLLVSLVIIISILIIPILLFTIFAIVSVAVAFAGFIIIEVMLMMIGMTALCCVISSIIAAAMVFGISLIVSTYVTYLSVSVIKRKLLGK